LEEDIDFLRDEILTESLAEKMPQRKTIPLPALLPEEMASQLANSYLHSTRLHESLFITSLWLYFFAAINTLLIGGAFALFLFAFFKDRSGVFAGINLSGCEMVATILVAMVCLVPVGTMVIYARRIGAFYVVRDLDQFTQLLTARRNMWTVFGIYSLVLLIPCIVLIVILLIGTVIQLFTPING
jgi:hypothetical protein